MILDKKLVDEFVNVTSKAAIASLYTSRDFSSLLEGVVTTASFFEHENSKNEIIKI